MIHEFFEQVIDEHIPLFTSQGNYVTMFIFPYVVPYKLCFNVFQKTSSLP